MLQLLALSPSESNIRPRLRSCARLHSLQLDHDDADVVLAAAGHGQLRQQGSGVRGGASCDGLRVHGGRPPAEAVPDDLASHLVGDHVPQPVAGQYEELVLIRPLHHRHLRLRAHVRLQVVVA